MVPERGKLSGIAFPMTRIPALPLNRQSHVFLSGCPIGGLYRIILTLLLLVVLSAHSQGQYPSDGETTIDRLPAGITGEAGKVTMVADFNHSNHPGAISVYLINRSAKDLTLFAEGGDPYLKLEMLTKSGKWIRAQPHAFSRCGDSYRWRPEVKSGHFFKMNGYQPIAGETATIRYRIYNQPDLDVATQAGIGRVLDRDIQNASSDELAVYSGSFDFVAKVATGERTLINPMDPDIDLQSQAVRALRRFPVSQASPILDQVYRKYPRLSRDVKSTGIKNHTHIRRIFLYSFEINMAILGAAGMIAYSVRLVRTVPAQRRIPWHAPFHGLLLLGFVIIGLGRFAPTLPIVKPDWIWTISYAIVGAIGAASFWKRRSIVIEQFPNV